MSETHLLIVFFLIEVPSPLNTKPMAIARDHWIFPWGRSGIGHNLNERKWRLTPAWHPFILPGLTPLFFVYFFDRFGRLVLVVRFVSFRSFCFDHFGGFACFVLFSCFGCLLMSIISMILFLHPGCLREMKFSGNTVKKRSKAEQKEGSKPASNFVAA